MTETEKKLNITPCKEVIDGIWRKQILCDLMTHNKPRGELVHMLCFCV